MNRKTYRSLLGNVSVTSRIDRYHISSCLFPVVRPVWPNDSPKFSRSSQNNCPSTYGFFRCLECLFAVNLLPKKQKHFSRMPQYVIFGRWKNYNNVRIKEIWSFQKLPKIVAIFHCYFLKIKFAMAIQKWLKWQNFATFGHTEREGKKVINLSLALGHSMEILSLSGEEGTVPAHS